jgi:adenosylmethionine-8-amino-7-oxononanoate aminotransferase
MGRVRSGCDIECIEGLEEVLAKEGHRVAAVIAEPMLQGAGGMIVWPVEFLARLRRATRDRGILLIADEVLTGFGRTGRMFACEHAQVTPDILCLSKGITGGYLPLAATLCTDEVYDAFLSGDRNRTFFHGHSYTANALACAVALESLAIFDDEKRLERVVELERLFKGRLEKLRGLRSVADVRGIGAVAAIETVSTTAGGYLDRVGEGLRDEFLRREILLRPLGNVVYFMPPYVITDEEVHRVFDAIEEVVGKL